MKKLLLLTALLAALIGTTATAQQRLVRLTRYNGLMITGLSVASGFEVHLEKSSETKVVVELSEELESLLNFSMDTGGIVRLSLNSPESRPRFRRKQVAKVTIYLPTLRWLRVSGGSTIYTNGNFFTRHTDIVLSGGAELKSLELQTNALRLMCGGASQASIRGSVGDLHTNVAGASTVNLDLKCHVATVNAEGASNLTLVGESAEGTFTASSSARIQADEFSVNHLNVTASSASAVRVWAIGQLQATATSASSIRYRGEPGLFETQASSAASIRQLD
ncbi:MAG: DUF2807 domain-containing protein [Rikenellaceae bacterium]|jgi:hypothetical protein|nr:DUF2807 domain-containing protein [Rikenellaceae bacterium]